MLRLIPLACLGGLLWLCGCGSNTSAGGGASGGDGGATGNAASGTAGTSTTAGISTGGTSTTAGISTGGTSTTAGTSTGGMGSTGLAGDAGIDAAETSTGGTNDAGNRSSDTGTGDADASPDTANDASEDRNVRVDGGCDAADGTCTCPANNGNDVYVDPVAGSDAEEAGAGPTGVQVPARCRFATLTKGLSRVGPGGRVVAISDAPPVAFTAEPATLVVPMGVTLTTADTTPTPAHYTIDGQGVSLSAGATFRGFSVLNASVAVTCSAGTVTLDNLVLSGPGSDRGFSGRGFTQSASCSANLSAVSIHGFSNGVTFAEGGSEGSLTIGGGSDIGPNGAAGLLLWSTGTTTVADATIHDNLEQGIWVSLGHQRLDLGKAGTITTIHHNGRGNVGPLYPQSAGVRVGAAPQGLTMENVQVYANMGIGVFLEGDAFAVVANIKNSTIHDNTDIGVLVSGTSHSSINSSFTGNDIYGNNAAGRDAAGILFATPYATLSDFSGNKIHSNVGAQVGFSDAPATGSWRLAPASNACDASSSSITCYGTGNVGLFAATGVAVNAELIHWQNAAPTANVDLAGDQVDATHPCAAITTCP